MCTSCGDILDCSCNAGFVMPIGPKGDTGPQGIQGVQGIQGIAGNNGNNGNNGSNGTNGISITWLGSLIVAPGSPTLNQAYYNSVAKISYIWDGNSWEILAKDGAVGATGLTGLTGPTGPAGSAFVYETLDGNLTPAESVVANCMLIRNATNTGYQFINISTVLASLGVGRQIDFNTF